MGMSYSCDKCRKVLTEKEYRAHVATFYSKDEKPTHQVFHLCAACFKILIFSVLGMKP